MNEKKSSTVSSSEAPEYGSDESTGPRDSEKAAASSRY